MTIKAYAVRGAVDLWRKVEDGKAGERMLVGMSLPEAIKLQKSLTDAIAKAASQSSANVPPSCNRESGR